MASVKAYRDGDPSAPAFPDDFDVRQKAVLQVTDIKTNRNKYYAVELHVTDGSYRVFTHYGRTDDLETNPNAGAKESRFFDDEDEAEACYQNIYREKTSASKGYKEVALASSKIGSQKSRGSSSGAVDDKTIAKLKHDVSGPAVSSLAEPIQALVKMMYAEATTALTTTVAAKITADGIETPLGILTLGQIEQGDAILAELYVELQKPQADTSNVERLSGEFYTAIPHRIGRSRAAIQASIIDTPEAFRTKQDTLQLMKDMLLVSSDGGVLFDAEVDAQYKALRCEIRSVDRASTQWTELETYVRMSQVKKKTIKVENIYMIKRPDEWDAYDGAVGNERQLYHGSRIQNWVGLLSRGILMPKLVVSMGGSRTDEGWLGNGIYFGDASCTSAAYTTPSTGGTRLMALARVALGRISKFDKITYGMTAPPAGFDSCHGVRNTAKRPTQFADDEFVVYQNNRQRMEALIEFTA